MNNTLKTSLKGALAAGLAAAAVSGHAQSIANNSPYVQGDIIAGFTTTTGNDLIVNLGTEGSLYNGETWNLSGDLTGNLSLANSVDWGVVGVGTTTPNTVYANVPLGNGQPLNTFASQSAFNNIKGAIGNIGGNIAATGPAIGTPAASANFSWNGEALGAANGSTSLDSVYGDPGDSTTPGQNDVTEFWSANQSGGQGQLLDFTLESNGTLLYGSSAVPEPAAYGFVSGAGLLLLALRRQFARKA